MWFADVMPADAERTPPSGAVSRARAVLEKGELWRARDILIEHLDGPVLDPEALALLGDIHHSMGDLPAAGAAWFGAGLRGPDVDEAVGAWRERFGDDFPRMWLSLPRSVRLEPRSPKVEALRLRALEAGSADEDVEGEDEPGGIDAAQVIAWILAAVVVVAAVVGLATILQWMVPGG
jgi:hypothetical protein